MVTQLQPDVRAYLHGGEVIKRYIRIEEVAHEYGFSVEETEYIAKAASSLYKLTRINLVKKERFDEFMKHIYKVPGTNKQIIKKFARIGEASIIYSIGRHRFIELAKQFIFMCELYDYVENTEFPPEMVSSLMKTKNVLELSWDEWMMNIEVEDMEDSIKKVAELLRERKI